jgi:hypothetical protein
MLLGHARKESEDRVSEDQRVVLAGSDDDVMGYGDRIGV